MRFSIIIPAYNSSEYIEKALQSIKQQVFTDYELLVICDSCKDNTKAIAEKYGAKTLDVNYGCDGPTRNKGIDLAQGEYILFMDDDDWWLHEFVLSQLDMKLKETNSPDILCFSFIFKSWKYASPKGNSDGYWVAVWNKCWKRSFIGSTRFPNIYSTSDLYFHREMFNKHPKIEVWDMPMYYYNYMRKGSITESGRK